MLFVWGVSMCVYVHLHVCMFVLLYVHVYVSVCMHVCVQGVCMRVCVDRNQLWSTIHHILLSASSGSSSDFTKQSTSIRCVSQFITQF